jgi:histidinol-phosphate aminotransferase
MKSLSINNYIKKIKPYKVASHEIWDVDKDSRSTVLKLDWNEATIPPSDGVRQRILKLSEDAGFFNLYPSTENAELRRLLAEYVKLPESNIQYFASSDSIHEYIVKLYVKEDTRVLIQAPAYDNFRLTAETAGGKIFFSEIDDQFVFHPDKFERDIEDLGISFVYICNPNNPIGYIHSAEYIETLLIKYPKAVFLIDEAYIEFSGGSCKDLVRKYNNLLVTRTMSKAFALANFRFGYLVASASNIEAMSVLRNPKNITTFAQEAAVGVLSDLPYMYAYVEEVRGARQFFFEFLQGYKDLVAAYESEANFLAIKCQSTKLKYDTINYLKMNRIYVRDLTHSSILQNCLRITIGTQAQMKKVAEVLKPFFESYELR